jgi:HSP20 family molecular chaperone IbpA
MLYFTIYIFTVLSIVVAFLVMGRGGTAYFVSFSMACFGSAATLFLSASDRFDWVIISLGLFNFSLGLANLILPTLKKSHIFHSSSRSDHSSEPLTPFQPLDRGRPLSLNRPLRIPEEGSSEIHERLIDVFEGENEIRIYVELPGVAKDDIHLNITEDEVEIKSKNSYKTIKVPKNIDIKKMSSSYRNGVLEVTIQRKKTL